MGTSLYKCKKTLEVIKHVTWLLSNLQWENGWMRGVAITT
jgi:hypothetical protein